MLDALPSGAQRRGTAATLRPPADYHRRTQANRLLTTLRRWATSRPARLTWWLAVHVVVGAACVATVLALAHLTIHLLIALYGNIPPYTGVGQ